MQQVNACIMFYVIYVSSRRDVQIVAKMACDAASLSAEEDSSLYVG